MKLIILGFERNTTGIKERKEMIDISDKSES